MNRLFDEIGGVPAAAGATPGGGSIITARMNVSETDRELRVTAEMPGVAEDDIEVSLDDDVLTIRGEKRLEQKGERENFHFVERSFGTVQRSLRLPFPVRADEVQASFENGVLTVTLPKTAAAERTRRIELRRGAPGGQDAAASAGGASPAREGGGGR
jgi:HSP20 family protein